MSRALAATALALLAGLPAAAQTLDCRGIEGGRQVCTTSYQVLADKLREQAAERAQPQPAGPPAPFVTPQQRKLVEAVARNVVAGRCDKARGLAIDAGDLDLALEAARRCEELAAARTKPK